MIRKPFRTPLLRRVEESRDNDGVLEPHVKKRRISSDSEKTLEPQLIFKSPGISSLPRKPLVAINNPAEAVKTPDGGFEGYYNVLWYVILHTLMNTMIPNQFLCTGGSIRPKSTRLGMVMASYKSLAVRPTCKTFQDVIWEEYLVIHHSFLAPSYP